MRIATLKSLMQHLERISDEYGDHLLVDLFSDEVSGWFTICGLKPCRDMQMGMDSLIVTFKQCPAGPVADDPKPT